MRIGIDCREIRLGLRTGIGRFLVDFLECLPNFSNRHTFFLFGQNFNDIPTADFFKKIKIGGGIFSDQFLLKREIEKNHIDLFFSPYYKIPLFAKTKFILFLFDITPFIIYKKTIYNFYLKTFLRISTKRSEFILTPSNFSKNNLVRFLRIPQEKIRVVYLGIGKEFLPNDESSVEKILRKYNLKKNYILYVGKFKPHKNVNSLIHAYKKLPTQMRKKHQLVLIGGKLPPDEFRTFEHISREELPLFYSGAMVFVFPSLYEGFGLPPLEAMACGCPVISSDVSSLPEVLGDAPLYFPPHDVQKLSECIFQVLTDENLRKGLIEKGSKRCKLFKPESMTSEILKIFESVTLS